MRQLVRFLLRSIVPENPFRFMGPLNVITRVDHSFNMLDDMAELASKAASEPISEKKIHSLLVETKNVCLAAYKEGDEDNPRDLEGFILADYQPDKPRRIMIIALAVQDNDALLRLFLDRMAEYCPHGLFISVDLKACQVFKGLGFIVVKRVGTKYEMLRRY